MEINTGSSAIAHALTNIYLTQVLVLCCDKKAYTFFKVIKKVIMITC